MDRREWLLNELAAEQERHHEEDKTRLAEWFAGVVDQEHRRSEQRIEFTELYRQAHGLGSVKEDEK